MVVYDLTRYDTFKRLDIWLKELKEYVKDDCVVVLIGNKSDLSHLAEVKTEEALAYAKTHNFAFFETSALNRSNIQNAFDLIIRQIHFINTAKILNEAETAPTSVSGKKISLHEAEIETSKKKSCCF